MTLEIDEYTRISDKIKGSIIIPSHTHGFYIVPMKEWDILAPHFMHDTDKSALVDSVRDGVMEFTPHAQDNGMIAHIARTASVKIIERNGWLMAMLLDKDGHPLAELLLDYMPGIGRVSAASALMKRFHNVKKYTPDYASEARTESICV